jgi:hypothetical protein
LRISTLHISTVGISEMPLATTSSTRRGVGAQTLNS